MQNYLTKSVAGFSIEFALLNPAGFYLYTIYNLQGLMDSQIGETGSIDTNDVVFGIHAFMLASIQLTQTFMYDRGKQSTNWFWVSFLIFEFHLVVILYGIEVAKPVATSQDWFTIRMCGYFKAAITFIKYMP